LKELANAIREFRQGDPTIPQINVALFSRTQLLGEIMGGGELNHEPPAVVPFWAWKPDVPFYIGWSIPYWPRPGAVEMQDYSPQEVNEKLQGFLHSDRLRAAKDGVIGEIKRGIEREFQDAQERPFAPI